MADIIKVENETITPAEYTPATPDGPWTVAFPLDAPSAALSDVLMNVGQVTVEVTPDGGTALTGTARTITGENFLLVGRTDLVPVEG